MKKTLWASLAALTILSSGVASANAIYTLSGVTLSDGGTLGGSFVTNDALTSLVSANITASANGSFPGFTYIFPVSTTNNSTLPGFIQLDTSPTNQELRLIFNGGLTSSGAALTTSSYEFEITGGPRTVTAGRVNITSAVPEPSSLVIGGIGILTLAGVSWHRKRRVA